MLDGIELGGSVLNNSDKLKSITTFPQLVKYLRDELDWPVSTSDFEGLTFEYTPEELGIDLKVAAKIQEIRRLRPLTANQPWGIFFIKFEPKRLPVVALRRMLKAVALKKRATADSAERLSWDTEDLLFISNYGEEDSRQITFAQFSLNEEKKDLPTLKVLGWDNKDTVLHIDHVAESLSTYLTWPDDEDDTSAWRSSWRSAFTIKHREVIDTAKKLSVQLAHLARNIRERINTVLDYETENGPITKLMNAFKEALVHDLDNDGFADMYAQTIAYGLLSARIANPSSQTADDFASAMPVTNPFLKELMETFIDVGGRNGNKKSSIRLDFDELGVSEVVELLDEAKMEAVVRDFGDKNPLEDPVTHFYEQFFADYDNSERFKKGVFYTPRPVVSFIVQSVNQILQNDFGLVDGLADTTTWSEMAERIKNLKIPKGTDPHQAFVQILDPATGTGTFLVEVIQLIYDTMVNKWQAAGKTAAETDELWNKYVPESLLPRLHGYELMMAPYAIAHLKIGLKLFETGYRFDTNQRARIFLTNALNPAKEYSDTLAFAIPALAHEAQAVNRVKVENFAFSVVLGNPPYSHWSGNLTEEHRKLVDPYKFLDGQRIKERGALQFEINIQDDYVKFIRLAEMQIESTGLGIAGLITNNAYLDSATFRGMRENLLRTYDSLQIVNLHGSVKATSQYSREMRDENVFDIQQGVAINIAIKSAEKRNAEVNLRELVSTREDKYKNLLRGLEGVETTPIVPRPSEYLFVYRDESIVVEYEAGTPIDELFNLTSSGIKTNRDRLTITFSEEEAGERGELFLDKSRSPDEVSELLNIDDKKYWTVSDARDKITLTEWNESITPVNYRPFDQRQITYHSALVHSMRAPVMSQLDLEDNIALLACRQQIIPGFTHVFVSKSLFDCCCVSNKSRENTNGFPLFVQPSDSLFSDIQPNLLKDWQEKLVPAGIRDINHTTIELATVLLHEIYAQLFSSGYRERYRDELQRGYPRVFLPSSENLFVRLSELGSMLVSLHTLEDTYLGEAITEPVNINNSRVEKVSYSKHTVWINESKSIGFSGVTEEVWNFHIGSYQVCEKWLKDRQAKGGKNPRPGRVLTQEDVEHYQKIIFAISETIRIMGEIDEVIEEHGGWPGAFIANS